MRNDRIDDNGTLRPPADDPNLVGFRFPSEHRSLLQLPLFLRDASLIRRAARTTESFPAFWRSAETGEAREPGFPIGPADQWRTAFRTEFHLFRQWKTDIGRDRNLLADRCVGVGRNQIGLRCDARPASFDHLRAERIGPAKHIAFLDIVPSVLGRQHNPVFTFGAGNHA